MTVPSGNFLGYRSGAGRCWSRTSSAGCYRPAEEHFTETLVSSINAANAHRSTRCAAYTAAMFSETRYALNGDLRVAYRASREGPRDIVVVANWFTCCEVVPELPSFQGWVEAMTSLGRLIYFDQPGTGASDPVTPGRAADLGAMGRQHHRGARRSRESRSGPRSRRAARSRQGHCSRRHIRLAPPRWSCSTVTRMQAEPH